MELAGGGGDADRKARLEREREFTERVSRGGVVHDADAELTEALAMQDPVLRGAITRRIRAQSAAGDVVVSLLINTPSGIVHECLALTDTTNPVPSYSSVYALGGATILPDTDADREDAVLSIAYHEAISKATPRAVEELKELVRCRLAPEELVHKLSLMLTALLDDDYIFELATVPPFRQMLDKAAPADVERCVVMGNCPLGLESRADPSASKFGMVVELVYSIAVPGVKVELAILDARLLGVVSVLVRSANGDVKVHTLGPSVSAATRAFEMQVALLAHKVALSWRGRNASTIPLGVGSGGSAVGREVSAPGFWPGYILHPAKILLTICSPEMHLLLLARFVLVCAVLARGGAEAQSYSAIDSKSLRELQLAALGSDEDTAAFHAFVARVAVVLWPQGASRAMRVDMNTLERLAERDAAWMDPAVRSAMETSAKLAGECRRLRSRQPDADLAGFPAVRELVAAAANTVPDANVLSVLTSSQAELEAVQTVAEQLGLCVEDPRLALVPLYLQMDSQQRDEVDCAIAYNIELERALARHITRATLGVIGTWSAGSLFSRKPNVSLFAETFNVLRTAVQQWQARAMQMVVEVALTLDGLEVGAVYIDAAATGLTYANASGQMQQGMTATLQFARSLSLTVLAQGPIGMGEIAFPAPREPAMLLDINAYWAIRGGEATNNAPALVAPGAFGMTCAAAQSFRAETNALVDSGAAEATAPVTLRAGSRADVQAGHERVREPVRFQVVHQRARSLIALVGFLCVLMRHFILRGLAVLAPKMIERRFGKLARADNAIAAARGHLQQGQWTRAVLVCIQPGDEEGPLGVGDIADPEILTWPVVEVAALIETQFTNLGGMPDLRAVGRVVLLYQTCETPTLSASRSALVGLSLLQRSGCFAFTEKSFGICKLANLEANDDFDDGEFNFALLWSLQGEGEFRAAVDAVDAITPHVLDTTVPTRFLARGARNWERAAFAADLVFGSASAAPMWALPEASRVMLNELCRAPDFARLGSVLARPPAAPGDALARLFAALQSGVGGGASFVGASLDAFYKHTRRCRAAPAGSAFGNSVDCFALPPSGGSRSSALNLDGDGSFTLAGVHLGAPIQVEDGPVEFVFSAHIDGSVWVVAAFRRRREVIPTDERVASSAAGASELAFAHRRSAHEGERQLGRESLRASRARHHGNRFAAFADDGSGSGSDGDGGEGELGTLSAPQPPVIQASNGDGASSDE